MESVGLESGVPLAEAVVIGVAGLSVKPKLRRKNSSTLFTVGGEDCRVWSETLLFEVVDMRISSDSIAAVFGRYGGCSWML